jgi:molybdenum cofactor biosynthesis enzyme MoaA
MIALTWMIGPRCNYDCMYCPTDWHDDSSPHPELDKLKLVWKSFYNKTHSLNLPYKITFSGGEVTANKSFLPLVEHIKNCEPAEIFVTTNGSASLRYYKDLAKLVNGISFSVHSEHINEEEFFKKVLEINTVMVRPERSCHVNIMDEFWNKDRIQLYAKWLEKNHISYSVNLIDYKRQTRAEPILKGIYNLDQI